ncbi:MAG: mechanosensitive ion channel [Acidobacteriia bacterium]|nr:mechanosensitive ion channel [Terriglobia bacterium]
MKIFRSVLFIVLLALAGAVTAGVFLPGESSNIPAPGKAAAGAKPAPLVDQRPLEWARRIAALATTPEEQRFAQEALRLADQEVDLAFTDALRNTNQPSGAQTPEVRAIEARIQQDEAAVKAGEDRIKDLTDQAARPKGSKQENLQEQIELTKAELALDQDALTDAQADLLRAGGDAHSRIQQLLEEHEETEHVNATAQSPPVSGAGSPRHNLLARLGEWRALSATQAQLQRAQGETLNKAMALSQNHAALEKQVRDEQAQKREIAQQASSLLREGKQGSRTDSKVAATAALASLKKLTAAEKNLADLDGRVRDLQNLSGVYGNWSALIVSRRRALLHDILIGVLWIIAAILAAILIGGAIDHWFERVTSDRKQLFTLRAVARFTVQALAVVAILLLIFGPPNQLSTFLGLAGAGLTVALKDFIVSFFGWFVLMGRNGIRVGDWVEINGVRGQVVEISLLRTVLLETGNWTEAGHPTGRKVTFLNSFAVEGHYFNFTTSGQWLWDELRVRIPQDEDPYPLIAKLRALVAEETKGEAQLAEKDWEHVTRRYGVRVFSADPTVDVRATEEGLEVTVRYITRAAERYEVRSRLGHAAIRLLHGRGETAPPPEAVIAGPAGAGENVAK